MNTLFLGVSAQVCIQESIDKLKMADNVLRQLYVITLFSACYAEENIGLMHVVRPLNVRVVYLANALFSKKVWQSPSSLSIDAYSEATWPKSCFTWPTHSFHKKVWP